MCFRLGIDMGSVLHHDERVYCEAVNIAARLQAIAPSGGVFISGAIYERVRDRLSLEVQHQGERELKNIPRPVKVYRLYPRKGDCPKEREGGILRGQSIALVPSLPQPLSYGSWHGQSGASGQVRSP